MSSHQRLLREIRQLADDYEATAERLIDLNVCWNTGELPDDIDLHGAVDRLQDAVGAAKDRLQVSETKRLLPTT